MIETGSYLVGSIDVRDRLERLGAAREIQVVDADWLGGLSLPHEWEVRVIARIRSIIRLASQLVPQAGNKEALLAALARSRTATRRPPRPVSDEGTPGPDRMEVYETAVRRHATGLCMACGHMLPSTGLCAGSCELEAEFQGHDKPLQRLLAKASGMTDRGLRKMVHRH